MLSLRPNVITAFERNNDTLLFKWSEYCNKVSEISNRLTDIGLPMSYHAHMGTIIQSEEDINKLLDNTNDKTFFLYELQERWIPITSHTQYST